MTFTLRALRVNAGMDLKTAAEKLQITPETLSNWERARTFPNVPQITALEKLYGTSYADIDFLPVNIGKTEGEGA